MSWCDTPGKRDFSVALDRFSTACHLGLAFMLLPFPGVLGVPCGERLAEKVWRRVPSPGERFLYLGDDANLVGTVCQTVPP